VNWSNDPTEEEIRARAFKLWEAAGSPCDREQEFWFLAERELKTSTTDTTPAKNPDEVSSTFLE
jgi:hypothetical protein